jgi:hypothetical protein
MMDAAIAGRVKNRKARLGRNEKRARGEDDASFECIEDFLIDSEDMMVVVEEKES